MRTIIQSTMLTLLVALVMSASAQEKVLSGIVYKDGKPAGGVTVEAHKTGSSAFTSFDGKYEVKVVEKTKWVKFTLIEETKKIDYEGQETLDVYFGEKPSESEVKDEGCVKLGPVQKHQSDPEFRKNFTYVDYYTTEQYEKAYPLWSKIYRCYPNCTKNIYVHGAEMLSSLIENESDEEVKNAYIDTLMMMYDKRMKYFKQKSFVLGRKGVDLLKYRKSDVEKAYKILKEAIEIGKEETEAAVLLTFMQATAGMFLTGDIKKQEVLNNFTLITDLLSKQIANAKDDGEKENINIAIKAAEEIFAGTGAGSCSDYVAIFKPQYEKTPDDVDFLKRATKTLRDGGCEGEELFSTMSEQLFKLEPSEQAAYNLAKVYYNISDYDRTEQYFLKTIEQCETDAAKADYYFQLASVMYDAKSYSKARKYANKAASLKSGWGQPYILIGNAYLASRNSCGSDAFEQSAVYWVAVDKFIKAKSVDPSVAAEANKYISTYSQYFPDKQELFMRGILNQEYTVGCWINEKTIARPAK